MSWDNASGKETQPASASKKWTDLTAQEKSSVTVLGYAKPTRSTIYVTKKTPWSDLTVAAGEDVCYIANARVLVLVDANARFASVMFDRLYRHLAHKVLNMLIYACIA